MSKLVDRIKELQIQTAFAILSESGMDSWESYKTLKASYDLRDEEERGRLNMMRAGVFELTKKFAQSETPNNLNSLLNQIERLRVIES